MRKILLFLIFVFLLPAVLGALPEGTYGSGLYGKGLYGVSSSAKATFTIDVEIPKNTTTSIEANQSNTTLELVTDAPYSGFVTIVRYDSAPLGTGSSPASSLNKYISIGTEPIDLNYSVIKLKYSDAEVSSANIVESSMRLYKWNGSQWLRFDGGSIGGVDTSNNFVFANTTSFSIWGIFGDSVPAPTPSPAPSGGSGGGGGGGGYYEPPKKEVIIDGQTIEITLSQGESYKIFFKNDESHNLTLDKLYSDRVNISTFSEKQTATLHIEESKVFSFGNLQLAVILKKIVGGSATFKVMDLTDYSKFEIVVGEPKITIDSLNIIEEPTTIEIEPETPIQEETPFKEKKFGFKKLILAMALMLILFIISFTFGKYIVLKYFKKNKKEAEKKYEQQKGNKREN